MRWQALVVFLSLSCDRSQDISCIGSSDKIVRIVSHAYVVHMLNLVAERWVPGSVNILTHWTDAAVFTQSDQWKGFLSAMVTAHEADLLYMRNFLEEITKNKYNQGGLTLKDLKPDIFESNEKSKLSFRQWSDEFSSWVERIDQDFGTMLRSAAQMQQWDKDKFIAEAQQEYRLGVEKIAEFDKHILFFDEKTYSRYRSRDCGHLQDSRRSLVPTHRPVLQEERARRNRHCQSTPRVEATHPDCGIFSRAERDQEVGQRIRSTVSKGTDAQRDRQSGVHESGPSDLPQSDGNTSRREQS